MESRIFLYVTCEFVPFLGIYIKLFCVVCDVFFFATYIVLLKNSPMDYNIIELTLKIIGDPNVSMVQHQHMLKG